MDTGREVLQTCTQPTGTVRLSDSLCPKGDWQLIILLTQLEWTNSCSSKGQCQQRKWGDFFFSFPEECLSGPISIQKKKKRVSKNIFKMDSLETPCLLIMLNCPKWCTIKAFLTGNGKMVDWYPSRLALSYLLKPLSMKPDLKYEEEYENVLSSHTVDPGLILNIPHGPLSMSEVIPGCRAKYKSWKTSMTKTNKL